MTGYKREIWKHRFRIVYRTVLAVLLVVVLVMMYFVYSDNQLFESYEIMSEAIWDYAGNQSCVPVEDMFLTYGTDGAYCVDRSGNMLWNRAFQMEDPMMDICQDTVAFCQRNGKTIYVSNREGNLYEIQTTTPVSEIAVSADGYVLAVQEDADYTGIYYYSPVDGQGKVADFRVTMEESGYPVSIDVSYQGKIVAISYCFVTGSGIYSRLAFYNFGNVGANITDNLVSAYTYEDVYIPYVKFFEDGRVAAVASDRILFYEGEEIPVLRQEILLEETVLRVTTDSQYEAILSYHDSGETTYVLSVYSSEGNKIVDIPTNMEYERVLVKKDIIMLYNASECAIYNIKGVCRYSGEFEEAVRAMLPLDLRNQFLVATDQKVQVWKLK